MNDRGEPSPGDSPNKEMPGCLQPHPSPHPPGGSPKIEMPGCLQPGISAERGGFSRSPFRDSLIPTHLQHKSNNLNFRRYHSGSSQITADHSRSAASRHFLGTRIHGENLFSGHFLRFGTGPILGRIRMPDVLSSEFRKKAVRVSGIPNLSQSVCSLRS